MTKNQKSKLLLFCLVTSLVGLGLFVFFPAQVHAEAIFKALTSTNTDSPGFKVQQIWKSLLNVVNSLVVLVLIFVAFAEMLRINVNTYGLKKTLPTLILAIIAANFSYMFCRLIIDFANVSLTFVSCISSSADCKNGTVISSSLLSGKAVISAPTFSWPEGGLGTALVASLQQTVVNLLCLVEAILLICLAFLFIVRNWVIYALVIFSPLAFMALSVTQTKKYFNQWWTMLFQWAFMPLVSFIFLALANVFSGMIMTGLNSGLMGMIVGPVFVCVCLYYAITMPFKLGGQVMQQYYQKTGAKWGVNTGKEKIQKKWVDPLVQEQKDKILTWYRHTGNVEGGLRGGGVKGAIGYIARRSQRAKVRQTEAKRAAEGAENSLEREAFGGKFGQFEGELRGIYRKNNWAQHVDSINGDFGEAEWIRKKLLNDWFEGTPEGRKALDRSQQYAFRFGGEETREKVLRGESELLARDHRKDVPNRYHDDTEFGHESAPHHFHDMQIFNQHWEERAKIIAEAMLNKTRGDAITRDQQNALPLNRILSNYKYLSEYLRQNDSTLLPDQKRQISEAIEKYRNAWNHMTDQIRDRWVDATTGQLRGNLALVQSMFAMRADGTLESTDIDRATTLQETFHIPENSLYMFESRVPKVWTLRAKEEQTSEAGKRTPVESGRKLRGMFRTEPEVLDAVLNNNPELFPDGHTLEVANAAIKNNFIALSNANNPEFAVTAQEDFVPNYTHAAKDGEHGADNRELLFRVAAQSISDGLNNTYLNDPVIRAVKAALVGAGVAAEDLQSLNMRQLDELAETHGTTRVTDGLRDLVNSSLGIDLEQVRHLGVSLGISEHGFAELTANPQITDPTQRSELVDFFGEVIQNASRIPQSDRRRFGFATGIAKAASQRIRQINAEPGVVYIERGIDGIGGDMLRAARREAGAEGSGD